MRRVLAACVLVVTSTLIAACGSSPAGPSPNPGGGNTGGGNGGSTTPPPNTLPVIDSITIQGTRSKEPPNFADAAEAVPVSAKVHDDETAVERLGYAWTATTGTFTGSGANVTWVAPAAVDAPADVTITLTVTEEYGNPGGPLSFTHTVTKTATLSLHDSIREVGGMARQFLLDFSDTNIKNADLIMRNFGSAGTCPDPGEVTSERGDVVRNYTFFNMIRFTVGAPNVTVNFGGLCPFRGKRGDACAVVPVLWDSVDLRISVRSASSGNDIVAAAYSGRDSRWFLCASDYDGHNLLTGAAVSR
jgi:hypothetical protein